MDNTQKLSNFIPEMEVSKSKIKLYASLAQKKNRDALGLFVAEGPKCVGETLGAFALEALIALPEWLDEHGGMLRDLPKEAVYTASRLRMEQLSSLSAFSPVAAVYRVPKTCLPTSDELSGRLTLVLDGVRDPGNMGTIMRIADWFGITHIVASRDTVDIFNPKTVQATMGAIARVKVCYTDLVPFLEENKHFRRYGTLLEGRSIYDTELDTSGLVIMGNEGSGISESVRRLVDSPLLIPPYPAGAETVESLNVAMATAITVAEFRRRQIIR